MDLLQINSEDILMTEKFFMTLKDLKEGDSFLLSRSYSTDDLTLVEIEDISRLWESTIMQEIIDRLSYQDSELLNNDNFGKVSIQFKKRDESDIAYSHEAVGSGEELSSTREFYYEVRFTALSNIKSGALLML